MEKTYVYIYTHIIYIYIIYIYTLYIYIIAFEVILDRNLVNLYILVYDRLWKTLGPHFLSGLVLIKFHIFVIEQTGAGVGGGE